MSKNNENNTSTKRSAGLVPKLRFPEFENSGEWEMKRIGDILTESKIPSHINDPQKRITVKLNYGGIEKREFRGTEATDVTYFFIRKKGQFIYGKQNFHKGAFGIIPDELDGFESSQDLPAFDFSEFVNPLFFILILLRNEFYKTFEVFTSGTGSKRLHPSELFKIRIPFPSLPEQQKIAACLSSLDELITAERQKLELLKHHKKGLLQNLFPKEGETVPKLRFPEFKNSGEWEMKHLGEILDAESSTLALNTLDLKQSGYAVYGADGVIGYIDTFQHKHPYISIVKDGSGVGRLNLCESETSILGTLSALKSKDENKYQIEWAYYLLNTIDFSSYVKGSGIPHIYYSDYKSQNIGVPKPKEQQKIADCLSSLDDLIQAQEQKIALLEQHKKGLLQGLFPNVHDGDNG